jgi:hypothetical protein
MFASSNVYRSVASTLIFQNLQKNEIMQNDLNQSKNFKRIETNSSFDELKKNFDASKMLMLNLNERFEQAKRLLWDREKLQKLKKIKTKIRVLKQRASEIIEELTKKIESKKIEFFSIIWCNQSLFQKKSLHQLFRVREKTWQCRVNEWSNSIRFFYITTNQSRNIEIMSKIWQRFFVWSLTISRRRTRKLYTLCNF